jgi:lipopolysaccharide exporter
MPSRKSVTLGSAIQLLVRIFGLIGGVIVVFVQARTLSVPEFGIWSTILLINGMAITLSDVGLMNTAVRRLAQKPERHGDIVSALVLSRGILGLTLTIGSALAAFLLFDTTQGRIAAIVIFAALPLVGVSALQVVPIIGLRLLPQNALLFLQTSLWTLLVVILGALRADIVQFAIGFLVCTIVQTALTWYMCGRAFRFSWTGALAEWAPLVRQAIPLGLGALGVTAYYRFTGIILFAFGGAVVSANFSAAFRIVDVLQAVPASLLAPLVPLLAMSFARSQSERVRSIWSLSSRLIIGSSFMIASGMVVLSDAIITLLYGAGYEDASSLLRIIAFAFIPISLGWLLTAVVTSLGEVKWYALITLSGAVLNIAASLVLVPAHGAYASAWITLATEVAVVAALSVLVRTKTRLVLSLSVLLRSAVGASVVGVLVYAMGESDAPLIASFWARGIVGIVAGSSVLFLARVITFADVRTVLGKGNADS